MVKSLLPPNVSKTERALEQSTARLANVDVPNSTLWNSATCPSNRLPWLAWALSVDEYSSEWPIDIQRQSIAQSVDVHKVKGTFGAVSKAVKAIDLDININEQQNTPHTFKADLWVERAVVTPEFVKSVKRAIDNSKNARSQYTLSFNCTSDFDLNLALTHQSAIQSTVYCTTEEEEETNLKINASIASSSAIRYLGGDPQELLHTQILANYSCSSLPRLIIKSSAEFPNQNKEILAKLAMANLYKLTQSVTECY